MAFVWWGWWGDDTYDEVKIEFEVHTDVEDVPYGHGMYLMLCFAGMGDINFYFGLQVDDRGERAIFSRWDTRDLDLARANTVDGWTQSSGHEGDFIGVRRHYDWGPGQYGALLASDGETDGGESYGLWITDVDTDVTTWIGSLWFPDSHGRVEIDDAVYSTVEVYGNLPIRLMDIPKMAVTISRPVADGRPADWASTGYSQFDKPVPNADIRYEDGMNITVGGTTTRATAPQRWRFTGSALE